VIDATASLDTVEAAIRTTVQARLLEG